jgi:FMN phosphatase YigB (HAD superfamily)
VSPVNEVKVIFWDIGGVLLTNGWDRDQRARVLGRMGVDIEDYESRHVEANYYWERGLSTVEHFFNQTVFTEPRPFTFEQLWSQVCAESKILHPGCFDILGTLAVERRFTLATLNNESRELNAHRLDAFRLRPYFNFFTCSAYVHEMKPNSDIYRFAIDTSGFEAEQALFIDDKIENCEAARSLGMQAIHFESPAQLRGGLAQLGIQAA